MLSANERTKNKTHLLRAPRHKSRPQHRGLHRYVSRVRPILRPLPRVPADPGTRAIRNRTRRTWPQEQEPPNCRTIFRQIFRLNHFPTERGTTSRQIIPTTTNTGDTRGGGQQRGTGHHHGRTRTDMGSRDTRGALARALTAMLEAGTVSAILPTTGIIFDSSGRPPAIIRAKRVSN